MEHIKVSGLPFEASRIALGTWAIGGWMWGGTEEKDAIAPIHHALDLGINLKGTAGTDRLTEEKPGGMCTHKVKLTAVDEVDEELKAWLKAAYERA